MSLDNPQNGMTLGSPFSIWGWALDRGAPSGTGVSAVQVVAIPQSGGAPIVLGDARLGLPRPDVGTAYGDPRFTPSGYALENVSLPRAITGFKFLRAAA